MSVKPAAILAIAAALVTGAAHSQAPAAYDATPQLVAAAQKEGKVVWYSATDVQVAEKLARAFEAKYPGVKVQVERSGAERIFQRINQEYGSKIHAADVVETSDAVHFIYFKKQGWLTPAVPVDVAKHWGKDYKDADGQYAAYRAHLSVIAYNTKLVPKEQAPKSHADLLDPKWNSKIVKAHPGYSGTIMTGTQALSQSPLGWKYLEQLGKQKIMQVQSSTEPPKKLAAGERPVMADGNEYNVFILKESGVPIEPVYAAEGTPIVVGNAAIMKNAPNPNAARLFYHFMFTRDAQQLNSDVGGLRSFHPEVKEKAGRTPLSQIKLLNSDPNKLDPDNIKKKYEEYFGT
ncbi:ABC transporter substrate-binding protein [Ramlibacter tataouinensis]|uniref:Candidate ABC type Fe3+ transport system, periplasmic component n=1 Tax=Ramlibacter tataouinensis (strain ATCC BAA-407 / DSM 14655 / LMG 21543 / TTB310) TaxID=365046 RepID=F5Y5I1_RAMTT|nr:extracellular solute-binding protein [Ramlibacter tataouinensis]AEG92677.1 candidate ABC type Fe3+ transport system, periplasmic component [Ramlibacter tataouinensis TTB310]